MEQIQKISVNQEAKKKKQNADSRQNTYKFNYITMQTARTYYGKEIGLPTKGKTIKNRIN